MGNFALCLPAYIHFTVVSGSRGKWKPMGRIPRGHTYVQHLELSDNYPRLRAEWALGEVVSSPPLEVERKPKTLEERFCYSVGNQLRSGALILAVHKNWWMIWLNFTSCPLPLASGSVGQDRIPRICIFNKLLRWRWRMWSLWSHTATSGLGNHETWLHGGSPKQCFPPCSPQTIQPVIWVDQLLLKAR